MTFGTVGSDTGSFGSGCHVTYGIVPYVTNESRFVTVETRRHCVDEDVQPSISLERVWYMTPDFVSRHHPVVAV